MQVVQCGLDTKGDLEGVREMQVSATRESSGFPQQITGPMKAREKDPNRPVFWTRVFTEKEAQIEDATVA